MGIKHFFIWYKKHFGDCIKEIHQRDRVGNVDNLCIDLNGIFHPCAQKIYEYGDGVRPRGLLVKRI